LSEFEQFLAEHLETTAPVNRPAVAVFVLADDGIKENSWEFFRVLGNALRACERGKRGWIELFAFDDGAMPRYPDPRINGAWEFYGLQQVKVIRVTAQNSRDAILRLCRDRCRAPKFVLVDSYQTLAGDFGRRVLEACGSGASDVVGYGIHDATVAGRS
jgi:hypothetical protein